MKRAHLRLTVICVVLGLALILIHAARSALAQEQPFYAGKTIRIVAGFAAGGTIDLRARLIARYLPKWIPGNPTIVVQNMTGAGGQIAANYVFGVAAPDGLTMLHSPTGPVMNTFLQPESVKYDVRRIPFIWVQEDSWLTAFNAKATKIKRAEDILRTPVKLRIGGSGVSSPRSLRPKLALELFGLDHTWVTGYKGSADLLVALERGEIHLFEEPMAGYKPIIQPREKDGTIVVLWQTGILTLEETFKRSEFIPHIPTLDEVLPKERKTGRAWDAWRALVVPQAFQGMISLPAGVPSERVAVVSHALEKLTRDPAYREEYEKVLGQPADALMGERADRVVKTAVKRLFEDYQEGVRYLRELSGK
ncbi:MAG: hypothetical protein HYV04_06610 [Deltaproteobacteria bacterium]|nr:hypothetical protein [Deltaproteobacteria bacterium]